MYYFSRKVPVLMLIVMIFFSTTLLAQGVKVTKRVMTEEEFYRFKNEAGVFEPGRNYNVIISGHGTGLKPPTEEQWEKIRNIPIVADKMEFMLTSTPAYIDNSATNWFPPIGNQDGEGSCTAWATTYYTKTFQEAREHGWDLSGCIWEGGYYGYPSAAYQDIVFSPDFVYHLINGGRDWGSWFWDAIDLMEDIGAASWENMPYDPRDSKTWPSEAAWREAPVYRNATYFYIDITTDEGITQLKNFIASENLAIIGVDANEYAMLSADDLWTSDTYAVTSVNHANTIVGYDNEFGPYSEAGEEKFGAFKVANSWGVGSWENDLDGFYWMSPQCLKTYIMKAHCYENIPDYHPEMIAVFEINHPRRGDCQIDVGIGSIATKRFDDHIVTGDGNLPFPYNKMVMDVTELIPSQQQGSIKGMLSVYDKVSKFTGTIGHFSMETYDDYLSGIPTGVYISSDTPLETLNGAAVFADVKFPGGIFW
jgi:C1A family cysteine protease